MSDWNLRKHKRSAAIRVSTQENLDSTTAQVTCYIRCLVHMILCHDSKTLKFWFVYFQNFAESDNVSSEEEEPPPKQQIRYTRRSANAIEKE